MYQYVYVLIAKFWDFSNENLMRFPKDTTNEQVVARVQNNQQNNGS